MGVSSTLPSHQLTFPSAFLHTFLAQEEIGWDAAICGFLALEWRSAQQAFLDRIKSRRSSLRQISSLIQKLWDVAWDMWEHRNHILHLDGLEDYFQIHKNLNEHISVHYPKGYNDLSPLHSILFHLPLQTILNKPIPPKVSWFDNVLKARQHFSQQKSDIPYIRDKALLTQLTTGGMMTKLS
eukprot:3807946-Ditylum_brightwellii.AAC.1